MKKSVESLLSIDQKNARKRHPHVGLIERERDKPRRSAKPRKRIEDPRQTTLYVREGSA